MTETPLSGACGRPFKSRIGLAIHARACSLCTPEALFWMKVDKTPRPKGCWLYTGFIKWDGYGWLARTVEGRTKYMTAHRYAWILTHGAPAEGMHILHECDIPACCNPAHLRLGTHQENMADQRTKGRHVHGERSRRNTVTYAQVVEMRRQHAEGLHWNEIADRMGVSRAIVYHAVKRNTWVEDGPSAVLHPNRVRPRRAA